MVQSSKKKYLTHERTLAYSRVSHFSDKFIALQ